MTKIHKCSQVAHCVYSPKELVRREEDSSAPSLEPTLSSKETVCLEEIALSETLGPAPGQWLGAGMSQGPPQRCFEDWKRDSLSDPCAFALIVVPPAHLIPSGSLKLLGKPGGGQRGNSFHLIASHGKPQVRFSGMLEAE